MKHRPGYQSPSEKVQHGEAPREMVTSVTSRKVPVTL